MVTISILVVYLYRIPFPGPGLLELVSSWRRRGIDRIKLVCGAFGLRFLWGRCISVMVQCATWRASAALFQAADGFGDVDEVVGDTLAVG